MAKSMVRLRSSILGSFLIPIETMVTEDPPRLNNPLFRNRFFGWAEAHRMSWGGPSLVVEETHDILIYGQK
jgi:hypothetical protein